MILYINNNLKLIMQDNQDIEQGPISDELYKNILETKEKHLDVLDLPGDIQKAKSHFKAQQLYDKRYWQALDSKSI